MISGEALMDFKKFAQSKLRKLYCEETIKINGTFKDVKTGKVIKNDIFEAHKLGKDSIEEIYRTYIEWFNYTKNPVEHEREFISVKLFEELKQGKNKK